MDTSKQNAEVRHVHNKYCTNCSCGGLFQPVVDMKNLGVTIYQYKDTAPGDTKSNELADQRPNMFVIINSNNTKVTSHDILPELDKREVSCPRCKYRLKYVQALLPSKMELDKNDIKGICDHCQTKLFHQTCEICEQTVKKLLAYASGLDVPGKRWLKDIDEISKRRLSSAPTSEMLTYHLDRSRAKSTITFEVPLKEDMKLKLMIEPSSAREVYCKDYFSDKLTGKLGQRRQREREPIHGLSFDEKKKQTQRRTIEFPSDESIVTPFVSDFPPIVPDKGGFKYVFPKDTAKKLDIYKAKEQLSFELIRATQAQIDKKEKMGSGTSGTSKAALKKEITSSETSKKLTIDREKESKQLYPRAIETITVKDVKPEKEKLLPKVSDETKKDREKESKQEKSKLYPKAIETITVKDVKPEKEKLLPKVSDKQATEKGKPLQKVEKEIKSENTIPKATEKKTSKAQQDSKTEKEKLLKPPSKPPVKAEKEEPLPTPPGKPPAKAEKEKPLPTPPGKPPAKAEKEKPLPKPPDKPPPKAEKEKPLPKPPDKPPPKAEKEKPFPEMPDKLLPKAEKEKPLSKLPDKPPPKAEKGKSLSTLPDKPPPKAEKEKLLPEMPDKPPPKAEKEKPLPKPPGKPPAKAEKEKPLPKPPDKPPPKAEKEKPLPKPPDKPPPKAEKGKSLSTLPDKPPPKAEKEKPLPELPDKPPPQAENEKSLETKKSQHKKREKKASESIRPTKDKEKFKKDNEKDVEHHESPPPQTQPSEIEKALSGKPATSREADNLAGIRAAALAHAKLEAELRENAQIKTQQEKALERARLAAEAREKELMSIDHGYRLFKVGVKLAKPFLDTEGEQIFASKKTDFFKHRHHKNKIKGTEIVKYSPRPASIDEWSGQAPEFFQKTVNVNADTQIQVQDLEEESIKETKMPSGVIRYRLSDHSFIDKGWTQIPTEKIVRKMNIYRVKPAHPEFDWFALNKNKGALFYQTGEKLADFTENGRGRWYYKNGNIALDYYDSEELNAQQRIVVYSNAVETDRCRRVHPVSVLAMFDYLGSAVVFGLDGKIRVKYNQTEGVVLDPVLGPNTRWKWHSLNDPPVLHQVMIDTNLSHPHPEIAALGKGSDDYEREDDAEMLAIEFDNFLKEKSKKLKKKYNPFQIRMKALKISEQFSLRIVDQAHVYLYFRDGAKFLKLNLGMILDSQEIIDTETVDVDEVANSLEKYPAKTDSLLELQERLAKTRHCERVRCEREQRIAGPAVVPQHSVDRMRRGVSRPLRPIPRAAPAQPGNAVNNTGYQRKPSQTTLYYDTRII